MLLFSSEGYAFWGLFLSSVGYFVVFLLTMHLCKANIQSVMTRFSGKKTVATSNTTLQMISKIQCAEICTKKEKQADAHWQDNTKLPKRVT